MWYIDKHAQIEMGFIRKKRQLIFGLERNQRCDFKSLNPSKTRSLLLLRLGFPPEFRVTVYVRKWSGNFFHFHYGKGSGKSFWKFSGKSFRKFPVSVYEWSKFQILVSIKIRSSLNFLKFWKSKKFFVKIRESCLFCFTMYTKRTCSQLN